MICINLVSIHSQVGQAYRRMANPKSKVYPGKSMESMGHRMGEESNPARLKPV